MKNSLIIVISLLICLSLPSHAQQNSDAINFLTQQRAEQLKNETDALSDPELIKSKAQLYRLQYLALVESGFSQEEALKIVIALASSDKD